MDWQFHKPTCLKKGPSLFCDHNAIKEYKWFFVPHVLINFLKKKKLEPLNILIDKSANKQYNFSYHKKNMLIKSVAYGHLINLFMNRD